MRLKIDKKWSNLHLDYAINPQADGYAVTENGTRFHFVCNWQEKYILEEKNYSTMKEMRDAIIYGSFNFLGNGVIEFTPE